MYLFNPEVILSVYDVSQGKSEISIPFQIEIQ